MASEIKHFFRVYKSLEGKETVVSDVLGRQAAVDIIIKCQDAYIENTASDIPRRHPRRWRRFFCGRETFSEGIASI